MTNDASSEYHFSAERMARMALMEQTHFWFAGRRKLIRHLIERHLGAMGGLAVDLGCGTGSMLVALRESGFKAIGLDGRIEGLSALRGRDADESLIQGNVLNLPMRPNAVDGVLILDTLEHLDDERALREVRRILRPDGKVIVSVPAIKWLWGYRDIDAGHLRRYSQQEIVGRLQDHRFAIEYVQYYQFLLFPLLALTRLLGKVTRTARDTEDTAPGVLNKLLRQIVMLEVSLSLKGIKWPWGSSLIIVAKKVD